MRSLYKREKRFVRKKNFVFIFVLSLLLGFVFVSLFAPFFSPYDPHEIHEGKIKWPPFWNELGSLEHPLGTDDLGRDHLSRVIFGGRVSLNMCFAVVFLSMLVGGILGLLAGFMGGWVDHLICRFVDVLMSLPSLLLALVVVAILGPGLLNAIFAVHIIVLPAFIRIVRISVMEEKTKLYIQSLRALGVSPFRILFLHIVPNILPPFIVQSTLGLSDGILNIAALGFLGLGVESPTPEWGSMLSDGRAYIETAPSLVLIPGFCILIVVLCFNFLGDILRDKMDPKLKN